MDGGSMSEIDLSLVGTLSEPFEVEIEKSEIRKFAEAIGDTNPLYRDEAYARSKGYASLLAPPYLSDLLQASR